MIAKLLIAAVIAVMIFAAAVIAEICKPRD